MFCNKCGANMDDDSAFCRLCGARKAVFVTVGTSPENDIAAKLEKKLVKDRKKVAIVKACTALFFALCMFGLPFIPIMKETVFGSVNKLITGYQALANPSKIDGVILGLEIKSTNAAGTFAAVVVGLCLLAGVMLLVSGVVSLVFGIKGKKSRSLEAVTSLSMLLGVLLAIGYMAGSLILRAELVDYNQYQLNRYQEMYLYNPSLLNLERINTLTATKYGIESIIGVVVGIFVLAVYLSMPFITGRTESKLDAQVLKNLPPPDEPLPPLYNENITPVLAPKNILGLADELTKYKKLLDDGVLTKEEFDEIKKQLLN